MSRFGTDGSGHIQVGGPVRFTVDPGHCTHAGINVCPVCAEFTEAETAAVRAHIQRLREERADLNRGEWNPAASPQPATEERP